MAGTRVATLRPTARCGNSTHATCTLQPRQAGYRLQTTPASLPLVLRPGTPPPPTPHTRFIVMLCPHQMVTDAYWKMKKG